MLLRLISFVVAFGQLSCDQQGDPFERVEKLRAFGVEHTPLVGEPSSDDGSQTFDLTFHLLLPAGGEVEAEAYLEEESLYAIPVLAELDQNSAAYEDFTTLRHYTIKARVIIPSDDLLSFSDQNKAARLRYAVRFGSAGEVEKVVGTLFVQNPDDIVDYDPLTVDISDPEGTLAVKDKDEIDLEAEVGNPNDEEVKVGWFVSSGRVENRRAKKTKWAVGNDEAQLIVVTVRGTRSKSFAYDIVELNSK